MRGHRRLRPYKWFTITASRAADESSVDIVAISYDPTKTSMSIMSGSAIGREGMRKSIHKKILERLSKMPE